MHIMRRYLELNRTFLETHGKQPTKCFYGQAEAAELREITRGLVSMPSVLTDGFSSGMAGGCEWFETPAESELRVE